MTVQAILTDRWVVPKKRPTFLGMTAIADIIDRDVL
jgi:hypothetical protein